MSLMHEKGYGNLGCKSPSGLNRRHRLLQELILNEANLPNRNNRYVWLLFRE